MNTQEFNAGINKITHLALNLRFIDSMSTNQLRNLFIEPDSHIKERLITSKNPIGERKQKRDLQAITKT